MDKPLRLLLYEDYTESIGCKCEYNRGRGCADVTVGIEVTKPSISVSAILPLMTQRRRGHGRLTTSPAAYSLRTGWKSTLVGLPVITGFNLSVLPPSLLAEGTHFLISSSCHLFD
ncbi:unnamed protein product [Pleuronectes platessa]|uniref:Uncharacterized protein n=1 Tax=Pleuronectes platessa TaxID=8262 RepID=A0A9N7TUX9_PLEPL|nr:unnamed protein product [Pleuronectes platessa]